VILAVLAVAATLVVAAQQSEQQGEPQGKPQGNPQGKVQGKVPGNPQVGAPLAGFAAQRVVVTPAQFLRADSGAPVKSSEWASVRKELDDSIGAAIAERGVGKTWAYAADIARMAKRNMGYASDPYSLGATSLRNRAIKLEDQAPLVLVNNLRSLIALGDARFALVPVELSFIRKGNELRPVLRLVLVDGRVGQIVWFGDIAGAALTAFSPAEIGVFAQRIADLVAAR
jgi:hypothetical protein